MNYLTIIILIFTSVSCASSIAKDIKPQALEIKECSSVVCAKLLEQPINTTYKPKHLVTYSHNEPVCE